MAATQECSNHWAARLLVGVSLTAALGCTSHMALPAEFSGESTTMRTDGREGDASEGDSAAFEVGPYEVHGIKRGLTFKRGFHGLDGFEPGRETGYSFKLSSRNDRAREFFGQCANRAAKTIEDVDGTLSEIEENAALGCTCQERGTEETRFYIENTEGTYGGPVSVAGVRANLVGVYETDGGDEVEGQPAGFRVDDENGPVAAADILPGEASVWFRENMDSLDQGRLLCTLVGIMLWVPPEWPEPEGEDEAGNDSDADGGNDDGASNAAGDDDEGMADDVGQEFYDD